MMGGAKPAGVRTLAGEGAELAVPQCERGIGAVVRAPADPNLIAGVLVEVGKIWPDDRGFFTEIARFGDSAAIEGFGAQSQISAALSFPGTIKAVHYHRRQTDLWAPLCGHLQVALFDLRVASPTFGRVNTLWIGEWQPWRLRIPPGVGHGYKVLAAAAAVLVYAADRHYDPGDEGRIPYDDPGLNYDWETQHK
ncbi:MAG TPA: dTDP-4-dehydrorhamnose 3,5-epimerase family protein [Terriglobales bacterium]|nr:dTDP-4-dehydrorhamnose 3,5-epimerase family protein [Terriglobales bacterium]